MTEPPVDPTAAPLPPAPLPAPLPAPSPGPASAPAAIPASSPPPVQPPAPRGPCGNCGTPLLGDHCYVCGQPVKGLVRHFSSIAGDFLDSVFGLDARTPRTLWPLFARPGYLTREYFDGRRVRYVTPIRLFFFLAVLTFFFARLTISFSDGGFNFGDADLENAPTVAEVERIRDQTLRELAKTRKSLPDVPGADTGVRDGEDRVRRAAVERIRVIREANARGEAPPVSASPGLSFGDGEWDAVDNPIAIAALPPYANAWLNAQTGRTVRNIKRLREDPDLFKDALLGAVPSTLFMLLPLFALMLKVVYLFKRRLYMEHLIVALHSHAFLCLALLLLFVLFAIEKWTAPAGVAAGVVFGVLEAAAWTWMPVYLLLMQKRVYQQGWPMTLVKYTVIGFSYLVMLSFGAAFTVLASLVWM